MSAIESHLPSPRKGACYFTNGTGDAIVRRVSAELEVKGKENSSIIPKMDPHKGGGQAEEEAPPGKISSPRRGQMADSKNKR